MVNREIIGSTCLDMVTLFMEEEAEAEEEIEEEENG